MSYEYHQNQLRKRCRVCGNVLLGKKSTKSTVYICSANQKELLSAFGIDVCRDKYTVHPENFCNTCNTKMHQYNKATDIKSKIIVAEWQEHTEGCTICETFQQRGRPRKSKREEERSIERLNSSTVSSWGDPNPLDTSRFLPPAQGISLRDLQCIVCMYVADRPVQTSCGKLVCYKCIAKHFRGGQSKPICCSAEHPPTSFLPAPEVLVKVISNLIIHCSSCSNTVELKTMSSHIASGCALTVPPSPSRLTIGQIMSQPADAPLMAAEKRLATSVVKRIFNTSPQDSGLSADIISLPTAGQVIKMHGHTQHKNLYNCTPSIPATHTCPGDQSSCDHSRCYQ